MKSTRRHQASHPFLTIAQYLTLFVPAILLIVLTGRLLGSWAPQPRLWQILLAAPFIVLLFVTGMLLGAILFLLVLRRFVPRRVLEPYYEYPGVPIFSNLSARLFHWAYRNEPAS